MNSILLISLASPWIAMAPPPASGQEADPMRGTISFLVPLILMFGIFYLIIIRPQQKQQKELRKMLDALKVGDRVLTSSGIFGLVSQIKDKNVTVKIADNTKVEMLRTAITQVLRDEAKAPDAK